MKKICHLFNRLLLQQEYNQFYTDQQLLHPLTLYFRSAHLEQEYNETHKLKNLISYRVSIIVNALINLIYAIQNIVQLNSTKGCILRSSFFVFLCIGLLLSKKVQHKAVISNFIITINGVISILLYAYNFKVNETNELSDFKESQLLTCIGQSLFAMSFFLAQTNYIFQAFTITSFDLVVVGMNVPFSNWRLWSHYILILFAIYMLRSQEKVKRLNFLHTFKLNRSLKAHQKIYDEAVSSSIIIVENEESQSLSESDYQNLNTQHGQLNVLYYNKQAMEQFIAFDSNSMASKLTTIFVQINQKIINIPQKILQHSLFIGRNSSSSSIDIEYDVSTKKECMQCYWFDQFKKQQFFDVELHKCIWQGKQAIMLILHRTTDRVLRIQQLQELDNYKNNLLASVSHDLRTPLQTIGLITQLLQERIIHIQFEESIKQEILINLEDSLSQQQILQTMINDLIDHCKIQKQQLNLIFDKFNLTSCLGQIERMFRKQIEMKKIQFIIDKVDKILFSDQTRLIQILFNLVQNAIKFTHQGSIQIQVKSMVNLIKFTVKDSGVGIPHQLQKELFQPYKTYNIANMNKSGVGLGLAISKNLVGLLGPHQEIELFSQPGEGSKFEFEIFQDMNKQTYSNGSPIQAMPSFIINRSRKQTKQTKILIADDDSFNVTALKQIVAKTVENVTIHEAFNGQEAADKACNIYYDLIFMDANMPLLDGLESIAIIRKHQEYHETKSIIILLSGQQMKQECQADTIIEKPLTVHQLKSLLVQFDII